MFGQQKRQVPKPKVVGPHQSTNPMFSTPEDLSRFRSKVLWSTVVCLIIGAVAFLIYGPLFTIQQVSIQGTRLIEPTSLERAINTYLDGQRWLVLPNRTLWILSSRGLANTLETQIRQRISIEGIAVIKQRPRSLTIVVNERTPVANWTNGSSFGSIDSKGMIIEIRSAVDASLPTIRDTSGKIFTVDSSVVKQEVVTSFKSLAGYMRQANIEVAEYLIPDPVCPTVAVPETNTNTSATSTNTNKSTVNTNGNRNVNRSSLNANTSAPEALPCDREALRFSSQEIHAKLKDGPVVLFDRHANLEQSVQALKRVMSEPHDKALTSIDVRFGDRVYVQ